MISTTSTLAWHRKPLNANATILTECSFGVSYDRLLRVLTDVVPFEPSWKDLDHVNLRERGLESVVRLKEFLPNLDEINLSDNDVAYLTGLPTSLRFLSLANNRLGDLSSFVHLKNLESLDISGNTGVTSVRQLACLQHLRTLKADGCGIDSIEGIDRLDGLVSLSLCNNRIQQLRLENTAWTRLETLDASDNDIGGVSGLETLPALRCFNLDFNRLLEFPMSGPSPSIRILKLSNNSLESLDLTHLPNIRTVFADCNRVTSLSGTSRLRKLENLSLREQRQGHIDFPVKDLRDLRRLYLSYNPIPDAFPNEHFLNLTLLELSGCRLTTLPLDFAAVVPNCRVLILDNNFLTTLAPVSGAKRLRALSAVGNRLDKVKDLLSIWLQCTELETLDLRLNPMTLGFYASPNLATAPPNLNLLPLEDNMSLKAYKAIDSQHRHTLPNEWLAKRTAYRALVIEAAPSLRLLDGLKVGKTQRQRARELVERFAS
ncbi:L domain-like protein [Cystobasidium minutum MCA 4210]|uniref:L domain-like protein n=1 Tax=Cystobasidium minutum MCA 4210 TaxID=1397322 RepID=UPI0034CDD887|eukprot:jgi/Rhomi1/144794/e_gw1.4.1055.1